MGFDQLPVGNLGLVIIGGYLVALLAIGFIAKRFTRTSALSDFYLAGRNLGLVVLFLTLYATQYSGNTLLGFSGKAYQIGFSWLMSVQFMTAVIVAYLAIAPALSRLSKRHDLITPSDYLNLRYRNPTLAVGTALIMIFVSGNFAIAQLQAMGKFFTALSGGQLPLAFGVITLAIVMVIYETLGGMRSIAWTDAFQGVIMIITFALLIYVIRSEFGPLGDITATLAQVKPQHVTRPDGDTLRTWVSFIILFGLGASCYPMAIQRLYAAKSQKSLQRSIAVMAFMPLTTALIALFVGLYAAVILTTNISDPDQILPTICLKVMNTSPLGRVLVVVLFAAFLAALMSTADSALLSLASIFTRDIYAAYFAKRTDQQHLTRVSKWVSWSVMAILVTLALAPLGGLIRLLEIKMEMLVQVAPAFFLGIHTRIAGRAVAAGLIVGVVVSLALTFTGHAKIAGLHAGTIGLAANLLTLTAYHLKGNRASETSAVDG